MAARRVLITGAANPLGAALARRLLQQDGVERVIGLDTRPLPPDLAGRVTVLQADVRSPDLALLLRGAAVDAIVHNDVVQFAEHDRQARQLHDINVIGTLGLLAAAQSLPALKSIVVRASAAIYGSEPAAPAFITEDLGASGPLRTRFQRDCAELERMFETFARRHAGVPCTILRVQPVVGGGTGSPIERLFTTPVVLTHLGFDPRVQVIHFDDAVGAMAAALRRPVRGPVNVAAEGTVSLQRMLRSLRRPALPVAGPLYGPAASLARRAFGGPSLGEDVQRYLRHGRGVDTTRMRRELGFTPALSTEQAIRRAAAEAAGPERAAA